MITTDHAQHRMRQRGISAKVVQWLFENGTRKHLENSVCLHYLSKQDCGRLADEMTESQRRELSRQRNAYLIVKSGVVITVGYRYKRFRRGRGHSPRNRR